MGGICFRTRRFWWHRLSPRHAALPIHVTEFVAELIQMAMYSMEWGDDYTELIDNMAVVQSIRQGKPRDLRLLELLLARHHVAESMGARAHPLYIKSEDNVLADLLSRGKFDDFRREMAKANLFGFSGVDLNAVASVVNVERLLDRMIDMNGIS